jgi:hypothetical protein
MRITSRGPTFYILLPLFLVFFAVPYLFDLAFCEELYTTPLSQAALIDAEKVDPYDGDSSWISLDSATTGAVSALPTPTCSAAHASLQGCMVSIPIPILLTSRPPPVS